MPTLAKAGGRSLRVLVAEDNNVNQQVIKGMLTKAGHRVFLVSNGLEAVNAVMSTRYDVVLMDFQMPEMDGITATRRIRELEDSENAAFPSSRLTANAMKGDRETCLAAGMDDYVSKPIEPRRLFAAIHVVIWRRLSPASAVPTGLPSPTPSQSNAPTDQEPDEEAVASAGGPSRRTVEALTAPGGKRVAKTG